MLGKYKWCKRNKTLWDVLFSENNHLHGAQAALTSDAVHTSAHSAARSMKRVCTATECRHGAYGECVDCRRIVWP